MYYCTIIRTIICIIYTISRKLISKYKLCVRNFSGAKMKCMKDYLKPSLRENPNHVILHVGTNALNSERSPELTA